MEHRIKTKLLRKSGSGRNLASRGECTSRMQKREYEPSPDCSSMDETMSGESDTFEPVKDVSSDESDTFEPVQDDLSGERLTRPPRGRILSGESGSSDR